MNRGDRPDRPFVDRSTAGTREGQEEEFFIDVRGEAEQAHDLGDAGGGDVGEASKLGLVSDFAAVDELLHVDGQGRQV